MNYIREGTDKRKVFPVHDMKAYRGRRGTAPLTLNFDSRPRQVVNFYTGRFTSGKEPRYPLHRLLGGPQNRSEIFREEENLLSLLGFELRTARPTTQPPY